jgi:hypothetical protein
MRFRPVCLVALALGTVLPTVASASPVTLAYEGTISFSNVSLLPVGTPVSFAWTIDPQSPDGCTANSGQGAFTGSSTSLTVAGLTYITPSDQLLINANIAAGCPSVSTGSAELRALNWSGPDLPGFTLTRSPPFGGLPTQLFQVPSLSKLSDDLPALLASDNVRTLAVEGPFFNSGRNQIGATVTLVPVPEPSTLLLVLSGGLVAVRRVRRRFN